MTYEQSLYDINSYGIDYPIEVLVSMIERDDLVAPDFQRNYVWSIGQASRFIESCIVGLPIPTIFFFKDKDNKFLIVDGLQRLMTAFYFKQGYFVRENRDFPLSSLDNQELNGKTYEELPRELQRRFDQCVLRATVFAQNRPEKGMKSVYEVFSRLNSGGTKLTSHEVRNAIIRGKINLFLDNLNSHEGWRKLYGKTEPDLHKRDEEVILRILALHEMGVSYTPPMNSFLNDYMSNNENPNPDWENDRRGDFLSASDSVLAILDKDAFRAKKGAQINIAIADSLMVTFMQNARLINGASDAKKQKLKKSIEALKQNVDYIDAIEKNTSDTKRVKSRMSLVKSVVDRVLG